MSSPKDMLASNDTEEVDLPSQRQKPWEETVIQV